MLYLNNLLKFEFYNINNNHTYKMIHTSRFINYIYYILSVVLLCLILSLLTCNTDTANYASFSADKCVTSIYIAIISVLLFNIMMMVIYYIYKRGQLINNIDNTELIDSD